MTYSLRDQFYELLPAKLRAAAGLKSGASGSHLNSIINGFQVQGNSDIPSFLHHCAAWLSSFMMYQEWLLNERTRLTKVRVWFVVNAVSVFPIWPCLSIRDATWGNASPMLRLHLSAFSGGVYLGAACGNPSQTFTEQSCKPTLVSASPTEIPQIFLCI